MELVKLNAEQIEGYAITVNIEGDVQEYAMSFLHIFNNVRENKELIEVKNYYGNNEVTVYCELEAKEDTIKYLGSFGKIKDCELVLMYQTEEPDYDIDKYYDAIIVPNK